MPRSLKLTPAQQRLLVKVAKKALNDERYGVQSRQFASAAVLLRERLVVDVTDRAKDCTQFLRLATAEEARWD